MKKNEVEVIDPKEVGVVKDINAIANEINFIKEQTSNFLLRSSIEIGMRLKEAKKIVGHGKWSEWLQNEVDYSQRTATNLMKIASEYGNQLEAPNQQAFANLGYTQAVALLKLDSEERNSFSEENDIENMSTRALEEEIKRKKKLEKEKEELKKKLETEKEKGGEKEKEIEEKLKEIEKREQDIKEKAIEIKNLQKELKEKNKLVKSTVDTSKIEKELKEKNKEIEKLKKELSDKPKEIEKKIEVEVIPPKMKKEVEEKRREIEKLKKEIEKLSKKSNLESIAVFKATFENLTATFNQLLVALEGIKEEDKKEWEKYKTAVHKLLHKLLFSIEEVVVK